MLIMELDPNHHRSLKIELKNVKNSRFVHRKEHGEAILARKEELKVGVATA